MRSCAISSLVPPLSNQYVWLMKATTIGIAIGFSDLFMVTSTSINQSGQTIVLVTHEPDIAEHALRQVHLKDGHIERDFASPRAK